MTQSTANKQIRGAEQVMTHQPAISISISSQHPFNRAGGRTSGVRQIKLYQPMNIIRHTLIVAIACVTFASADTLSPLREYAYFDAVKAVGDSTLKKLLNKEELSDEENNKINQIISEAEPLFHLSPDALAELSALGGPKSKGTAISAVVLQETIMDYELLTAGKNIPTLITFYISQSKTAKLQPIQRVVCYVLIKSSMRKIQAGKAQK